MKALYDTNILLDLFLDRPLYADDAAKLVSKVESGEILGFLGATTVTTLDYLLTKALNKVRAKEILITILNLFEVAPVNRLVLEAALRSPINDFEDAVLNEAALHCGVQAIITRNARDFKGSDLSIYTPVEFLSLEALVGE